MAAEVARPPKEAQPAMAGRRHRMRVHVATAERKLAAVVGELPARKLRVAVDRQKTLVVAEEEHLRMKEPDACCRLAANEPKSARLLVRPKARANRRAVEQLSASRAALLKNRPWEAVVVANRATSFAELAAGPLCSLAARAASWVAVVEGVPHQTPMEQGQAPPKKTSSREDHRRRRDPIRPCHS